MRAFIAIDIPEEVKAALSALQKSLASNLKDGVRWVDPYSTHLTVKFLGEIDRSLTANLEKGIQLALGSAEEIEVETSGLGVFPNARSPRVLWVGLKGNIQQLNMIQRRVDEELKGLGFPVEKRPFSPHLTLGRVNDRVSREVVARIGQTVADTPAPEVKFTVHTLSLMESKLTPKGAQYTKVFTYQLKNKNKAYQG